MKGEKDTFVITIPSSLASLKEQLMDRWNSLAEVDFSLNYITKESATMQVTNDEKVREYLDSNFDCSLNVLSERKGFSSFSKNDAFKYAGIKIMSTLQEIFVQDDFDEDDELIKAVIDHAHKDLACKIPIFGPLSKCQEASVREFIGPVLVAAARITGGVKIASEKAITGRRGQGPVDYDLLYKEYHIVVTEAKKNDIEEGLVQNVAQVVATREDYVMSQISEKRKYHEYIGQIAQVPSSGLVSTGNTWVFTRYLQYPENVFYTSGDFQLTLMENKCDRSELVTLLRTLVGVLKLQKKVVDENDFTKKMKQ
jgi:hypothetical protein